MSVSLSIPISINYLGERVLLQRRPEGEPQVRAGEVPLQRHHHLAHPPPGRQGGHAVQQRPDRGRDTANLRVAPKTVIYMTSSQERHVDGSVSIIFPDGTTKVISPSGVETITFPDKTVVIVQTNGQRTVRMPREAGRLQPRHRVLIKWILTM